MDRSAYSEASIVLLVGDRQKQIAQLPQSLETNEGGTP